VGGTIGGRRGGLAGYPRGTAQARPSRFWGEGGRAHKDEEPRGSAREDGAPPPAIVLHDELEVRECNLRQARTLMTRRPDGPGTSRHPGANDFLEQRIARVLAQFSSSVWPLRNSSEGERAVINSNEQDNFSGGRQTVMKDVTMTRMRKTSARMPYSE
jgi:hypothetical protein